MSTGVVSAQEWMTQQFEGAEVGDIRRTRRLAKLATAVARRPGVSLPNVLSGWGQLKAGYRLLGNEDVTYEGIMSPHWENTLRACQSGGEYLIVEDTTGLDFGSKRAVEGLNREGKGEVNGMYVHTSLALRVERWGEEGAPEVTVGGLLGQQTWVRKGEPKRGRETRKQRLGRARESQRWGAVFDRTGGPQEGSRWTYVADRESDIFAVIPKLRSKGIGYIIRACWERTVQGQEATIQEAVSGAAVLGHKSFYLRARPGQKARTAQLEIRSVKVWVRPPRVGGKGMEAQEENVIEVREVGAPKGVEPVLWVLLTSWGCGSLQEALRVVKAYAKRWLIEEYHKALKTGTGIEESQLSSRHRLENLLGILGVTAVWLLNQKLLCVSKPDEEVAVGAVEDDVIRLLEGAHGRPKGGWTNRTLLVGIAKLGGFLGRKGDGDPGWMTIWRGWQVLMIMCAGLELMRKHQRCG
jgi:hypothetical protein